MTFRSSSRRGSYAPGITAISLMIITAIFGGAWAFMLMIGNIHHWWPFVPPVGYDTAVAILAVPSLITFVGSAIVHILSE